MINVGRGATIVDADLLALLDDGHLGGATLDVSAWSRFPTTTVLVAPEGDRDATLSGPTRLLRPQPRSPMRSCNSSGCACHVAAGLVDGRAGTDLLINGARSR